MYLNFEENRRYVEQGRGEIRRSREPWLLIALAVVMFVGMLLLSLYQHNEYEDLEQLATVAATTPGQHVSAFKKGSGKSRRFLITYTYNVDGKSYQNRERVRRNFFMRHKDGQAGYKVHYDPHDPDRALLSVNIDSSAMEKELVKMGIFYFITLLSLLGLLYGLWGRLKERRLIAEGRLVSAHVIDAYTTSGKSARLYVNFLGEEDGVQGQLRESIRGRKQEDLPQEGELIYFIWRDEKSYLWL